MCVYIRVFICVAQQNQVNKFAGIPVEKEFVSSIQTNDNQNVDGDMENLIVTSIIHSKKSTRFGSAKQITTTFGL